MSTPAVLCIAAAPNSSPRAVVVMSTNMSGMVSVSWRPPRLPNGDITGTQSLISLNVFYASASPGILFSTCQFVRSSGRLYQT